MAEYTNYELILSINGKHTTIAEWLDPDSSQITLELARSIFRQVVYGIWNRKYQKEELSNEPYCKDHQLPMVLRKGKFGSFYSCPHRENGEYCKYRPPKA